MEGNAAALHVSGRGGPAAFLPGAALPSPEEGRGAVTSLQGAAPCSAQPAGCGEKPPLQQKLSQAETADVKITFTGRFSSPSVLQGQELQARSPESWQGEAARALGQRAVGKDRLQHWSETGGRALLGEFPAGSSSPVATKSSFCAAQLGKSLGGSVAPLQLPSPLLCCARCPSAARPTSCRVACS